MAIPVHVDGYVGDYVGDYVGYFVGDLVSVPVSCGTSIGRARALGHHGDCGGREEEKCEDVEGRKDIRN